MSDLPMKQEDHPAHDMPDATDSYSGDAPRGASVSDAAVGLAQAREDNKPSNKYAGNNMISTMQNRSTFGDVQRNQRYNK